MISNELIETLAKKHKLPEEQIKLVIKSYYDGLRHYLSNPLESKGGVMVHGLVTFYINQKKMQKEIERLKLKTYVNKPESLLKRIDHFEAILKNTSKYERQKSKKLINK